MVTTRAGPAHAICTINPQSGEVNVFDALRKGLDDLADLCDVVEDKFSAARDDYNAAHPDRSNPEAEAAR